jgi:hypothetical protein
MSREIAARPPRRCSIDGDGMVIFGVRVVTLARKAKSSAMMGPEQATRPVTVAIGGCSWPAILNFGPSLSCSVTPSSRARKSRCHQSRRNSPSVMPCRPIDSCRATTSVMAASSAARSVAASTSPRLKRARVSARAAGAAGCRPGRHGTGLASGLLQLPR